MLSKYRYFKSGGAELEFGIGDTHANGVISDSVPRDHERDEGLFCRADSEVRSQALFQRLAAVAEPTRFLLHASRGPACLHRPALTPFGIHSGDLVPLRFPISRNA